MIPRRTLTIPEFCSAYGTGRTTTYRLIKEKHLRPIKIGRKTLIPVDEADRWFQSLQKTEAADECR